MKEYYRIIEDVIIILLFSLCIIFSPKISLILLGIYLGILILMVIYIGYEEDIYLEKKYKGEKKIMKHINKKEREKAKEDLSFFNEGEYITKEMHESALILEEYIKQLEDDICLLLQVRRIIKENPKKWFLGQEILDMTAIDEAKEKEIIEGVDLEYDTTIQDFGED